MKISVIFHIIFFVAMIIETIFIVKDKGETRSHWIAFLLLTGMVYAIIGYIINDSQMKKLKEKKTE